MDGMDGSACLNAATPRNLGRGSSTIVTTSKRRIDWSKIATTLPN